MIGTESYDICIRYLHQFIIILAYTVYDVTIDVNIEFPQHCFTNDMQFTQLEELFDEDYIEEVFNRICFLRGNVFSDQC